MVIKQIIKAFAKNRASQSPISIVYKTFAVKVAEYFFAKDAKKSSCFS